MEEKKVIAVFGGAFNPPLNSHAYFAKETLKKFKIIKKVVFIPVNSKYNKEGLASNEHRYNMLKIISEKTERIIVSDLEIKSDRSLYTIETLEKMKLEYPREHICFIIGTDNLKELSTWKDAKRLVSEFKIIVFARYEDDIDEIIEMDELLNKYKKNFVKIYDNENKNFSSSSVRNMIKKGKNVSLFIQEEVYAYIKKNKLYI